MYLNHFGINLSDVFNPIQKYYCKDLDTVQLLLLRYEDINEWDKIINSNCNFKFKLVYKNKTSNSFDFYEDITNKIKYSIDELNLIYNDYFDKFYTENEKKEFINKWIL